MHMISFAIQFAIIFTLLPSHTEARRRRFGLRTKKASTFDDMSNDVAIESAFDRCSRYCRPTPRQHFELIDEQ